MKTISTLILALGLTGVAFAQEPAKPQPKPQAGAERHEHGQRGMERMRGMEERHARMQAMHQGHEHGRAQHRHEEQKEEHQHGR